MENQQFRFQTINADSLKILQQTEIFIRELTSISHKHGVGIAGAPVLFVMDKDDFALSYDCDDKSNLMLTELNCNS